MKQTPYSQSGDPGRSQAEQERPANKRMTRSASHPDVKQKKKVTSRQAVALGGVILLVLMYLITLIVAIVDKSSGGRLFGLCLFATIAIPILVWIYTWMYGKLTGRKTIADFRREDAPSDDGTDDASNLHA